MNSLPSYLEQQAYQYRLKKARERAVQQQAASDFVTWAEREFFIPETPDYRLRLAPYQQVALHHALSRDADGKYVYSTVLWSDIKKSLKSTIAAARALYAAYMQPWAVVYIIANDLKQADSRVAYYIRRAIELNPGMKAECTIRNYKITLPNHSTIEAVPIDPTGEAGSNADLLVFSELWGWKSDAAKRMWTEMTLSPTKFGHSQRWIETYAGHEGESPILENLYAATVTGGTPVVSDIPSLELTRRESVLALWNTKPRLEWQNEAYYQSEAQLLHPTEFNRVHRNQWGRSESAFVPAAWWDACYVEAFPDFPRWIPMVFGLDAGISGDCFAIVGVCRVKGVTYVRYVNVWTPPEGGKLSFEEAEREVRRLARTYNVEAFVYDPYQLEDFARRLSEDGAGYWKTFPQGTPRLVADKALYDRIRERRLAHDGNAVLRQHVLNANAQVGREDKSLRLVKRNADAKIDAIVATSMAAQEADELEL